MPRHLIGADLDLDLVALFCEFPPVFQKIVQDLSEPRAIALHPDRNLWNSQRQGDAARFEHGSMVFNREPRELRKVDPFLVERDQPSGDSRDVKQVIDQSAHVGDLAIHHVADLCDHGSVPAAHAEQVNRVPKRGKRVPQFMGKHGEEFILGLVRLLNLSQQRDVAFLRPFLLRDIGANAQHAHGHAGLVEEDDRPIADPASRSVGTDKSKLNVVRRFSGERSPQGQIDSLHVVTVEVSGEF